MKMIDLFSGIGGFSLAGSWAGWETIVTCDVESFSQRAMKYHYPNAYHHGDIRTLNKNVIKNNSKWNENETNIISGGFPCQPFSIAGKRKGTKDNRNLWPEMFRLIKEIKPSWVVAENVLGFINWNAGLAFESVSSDLEAEGYETGTYVLPAVGVNAPHLRYRIWIVAYANGTRLEGRTNKRSTKKSRKREKEQFAGLFHPSWENFPTQSPVCPRDDGFSRRLVDITFSKWRNESIKALGNAIVPQVAYQIFKAINEYEKL